MNQLTTLFSNMKKFYIIFESSEIKEIGFFPQVYDAIVDFNIYDKNSAYHLNFSKANQNTLWPISKLSGKAKKTDLISHSFMGLSNKLIVSIKLYTIFSVMKTEGIQFIKSTLVLRKDKEEDYWIANPFLSEYTLLDIANCEFIYTDAMGKDEMGKIKFDSSISFIQAYLQNQKDAVSIGYPNHKPLIIKQIAFKNESNCDFFSVDGVRYGGIGFFVSQKLKDQIEAAGCTGIIFTDPNEKYP